MNLKDIIIYEINQSGPMPIDRYMELCLSHPEHGYYIKQDPLGAKGDFTTAPEISQIFGEMIGIWLIKRWDELGRPAKCALVELGPGRGTLMADILRTIKLIPEFQPEIHLVETSPVLQDLQKQKLGNNVSWHPKMPKLDIAYIVIANEFFDALPIKQFVGSTERKIMVENGKLAFTIPTEDGITTEICTSAEDLLDNASAGIIIDYGYVENPKQSTIQAVKNHKYHDFLQDPSDADLTALVDFGKLASGLKKPYTLTTQREFLLAHGADVRAKILGKEKDLDRLINPEQMGALFKVLCF